MSTTVAPRSQGKKSGQSASDDEHDGSKRHITPPLDLCVIIAEFLTGQHLLGTLANLNATNKIIQAATLPILYETVITKDISIYKRTAKNSRPPPSGFRYTKYLVSHIVGERKGDPPFKLAHRLFPNLAVILYDLGETDRTGCIMLNFDILKPVHITTILGPLSKTVLRMSWSEGRKEMTFEDAMLFPWGSCITSSEEDTLLFDQAESSSETYRFENPHLQYFQDSFHRFCQKDVLRSLWSYLTLICTHTPMALTTISIRATNFGEDDLTCICGPKVASSLHDGPMKSFGYPDIIIADASYLVPPEIRHRSLNDIQVLLEKAGAASVRPYNEHKVLTVNIPNPTTLKKTFSVDLERVS